MFAGAFFEGIEFPEKLLAQFLVGFGQQFFMGFPAFFLEFRVEIVRVGFEQRPEHLLVAVDDVVQHFFDRRIAFAQRVVFLAQLARGVFHLVLQRRVEKEREGGVIDDGDPDPCEQMDHAAPKFLLEFFALLVPAGN